MAVSLFGATSPALMRQTGLTGQQPAAAAGAVQGAATPPTDEFSVQDLLGLLQSGSQDAPPPPSAAAAPPQQEAPQAQEYEAPAKGKGKGKGKGPDKTGKKIPPGLAKKDPASLPDGNPWKAVLQEQAKQKEEQLAQQAPEQQALPEAEIPPEALAALQQLQQEDPATQADPTALGADPAAVAQQPPQVAIGPDGQPVLVPPQPPELSPIQQALLQRKQIGQLQAQAGLGLQNAASLGSTGGVVDALRGQLIGAKQIAGLL